MSPSLPAWGKFWNSPPQPGNTIDSLYGMIVAQARTPFFYAACGVPDTVNGRMEMVMLHVCLVIDRLRQGVQGQAVSQALFDRFCIDMDDNLREMGIGDLAVPKHMQRVGEAFYGRAAAYRAARSPDAVASALPEALRRNLLDGAGSDAAVSRLSDYVRAVDAHLAQAADADIVAARFAFPAPEGQI